MNVTGKQLIKRLRDLAKARDVEFKVTNQGKGSHSRVTFDSRPVTVPHLKKAIQPGTLSAILRAIKFSKKDLGG